MEKSKKPSGAYWVIDVPGGWGVTACVEGEKGHHPVPDYGPYPGKAGQHRAQGIVDRLNEQLGHGPCDTAGHRLSVRRVVGSTMGERAPDALR